MNQSPMLETFAKMKIAATFIVIMSVVLIASGIMLISFSTGIKRSLSMNNQTTFEKSLKFMRNTLVFVAINSVLMIAGTLYYFLSIVESSERF